MDEIEAFKNMRDCQLCSGGGPFSSCVHYHVLAEVIRRKALEEAAAVCEAFGATLEHDVGSNFAEAIRATVRNTEQK